MLRVRDKLTLLGECPPTLLLLLLFVTAALFFFSERATAETDSDADGYTDAAEAFMGTDPQKACNASTIKNDEQTDAWPPDFNDDKRVDIADIVLLRDLYGSTSGNGVYDSRFDLTADGEIDIGDLTNLRDAYGKECESPPPAGGGSFLETFDGVPPAPRSFYGASGWDVSVALRDGEPLEAVDMMAMHGPDCRAPGPGGVHLVEDFDDQVFICANHMMTAISGPQGQIFLTPAAMVDFSRGEAIIRFDGSSFRTSNRDWRTVWIQPWDTNLVNPKSQVPKDAILWQSAGGKTVKIFRDFNFTKNTAGTSVQNALADMGLDPSPIRRDTYEMRLSKDHLRITITTPYGSRVLTDLDIDPSLTWDRGIVQFGHQTYSSSKGSTDDDCAAFGLECPGPNTWHWDNVFIEPAIPFTIIRGQRYVKGGHLEPLRVDFEAPAPADSLLRFVPAKANINNGRAVEVSFDGVNWESARLQPKGATNEKWSVFHPVPEGTQTLWVRGEAGTFMAVDLAIWSQKPTPLASGQGSLDSQAAYSEAKAESKFACSIGEDTARAASVLPYSGRASNSRRL